VGEVDMGERYTGFSVGLSKCDECIYEAILKDHPEYILEPWGKRPIWAEYEEKSPVVMSMIHYGNYEIEAICLKHIEEMKPEND
jgi:hypothetical protein